MFSVDDCEKTFFLLSTFGSKYLFKAYIFYIWEEDIVPFYHSFSYFSDTITVFPTLMSCENHVSPDVFFILNVCD